MHRTSSPFVLAPGLCLLLATSLVSACAAYPEGLRETPDGDGPVVRVDWDAEPLPDIPFPNDLATRLDRSSPTGLRLNVSQLAHTFQESEARKKLDELAGFGVYAPIWVGFDARVDLADVAARHKDDPRVGAERFDDDALLVINVDPDSPDYLKPVALDLGEGRYPYDVVKTDRYFPISLDGVGLPTNDARMDSPTLVFETAEEDLNDNGLLDPGEDTDDDGVLDHPNVWPEGGDPRADLLTWYEIETNTLIARPVRPLREQTTYAVVLTDRLVGLDGSPVRSPWQYVNHTRQTAALSPLEDALPALGLSVDHVAYAWTFTTGNATGELVDVSRGLRGEGPFKALAGRFPAAVQEALPMHEMSGVPETWWLPADVLVQTLTDLGLYDPDKEGAVFVANYTQFTAALVGGSYQTPYLLADRDDGGYDDADEWWKLDATTGEVAAQAARVPFTCTLPMAREGLSQPYDVALWGHGYGSSRFDMLNFAWVANRMGMAACAIDYPGHGPSIDPQDLVLIDSILQARGLSTFLTHLQDARYRDLNNDGRRDSGGDQWTADAFHTRDMVRQAAVDWIQLTRALQACGSGTMALPGGGEAVSCDWDGDGTADVGGMDATYTASGGSLGGINVAVATAVMPELGATVPIVPGGGLLDIALRTEIGGAVEAMAGRLMTPLVAGYPTAEGGLDLVMVVNSVTDMVALRIATLPSFPAGGHVEVENLHTGDLVSAHLREDGSFRLSIAADALDPYEKRVVAGMPLEGPAEGQTFPVEDTTLLGDSLVVHVFDASGAEVHTVSEWAQDTTHEGVVMPAGSTLVAGSYGFGHPRNTPDLRRLAMTFAMILEPGDPIAYGPLLWERPVESLGGVAHNVLIMPVPGDPIVNINTGVALARAAGLIEQDAIDDRYGMTVDAWLAEKGVIQGLEEHGGQTCADGTPCLFDPDDLDDGQDGTGAPSEAPLRLVTETGVGVSALRMPYVRTTGQHGFGTPDVALPFDINTFAIFQIGSYLASGGTSVTDDPCLEDGSCSWIPALETP